jgi:hypothetical protein
MLKVAGVACERTMREYKSPNLLLLLRTTLVRINQEITGFDSTLGAQTPPTLI